MVAHRRARIAIAALADLVESCYDLHARELAVAVGVVTPERADDHGRPLSPGLGERVTYLLRKPDPS